MDPARWKQVRGHFENLIDLPNDERAEGLRAINDVELRLEVERLLARHEENTSALDQPAAQLVADALAGGASERNWDKEQIGRRIGAFKLDHLLGAGGMGTVYRAHRVEGGFEQVVAIKLLLSAHPGMRERFRNEQDILAGLNHPNIAQLIDGGETADGIPYLAMEYVDGVPITEHCRDCLPDAESRLRLLVKIAAALSHAHRNLVVHRDIKPTNILVSREDGRPKLLDFGIAKLMGEARFGNLTQQKLGPMTPAYAAPEQFTGGSISVATDVYQFGVLMFRLITGRLPYNADTEDPMAWGRAVLEQEPTTLARALASVRRTVAGDTQSSDTREDITQRDAVHTLARDIGRDLDAIVQACLVKDPHRRYGSMDALISDLEAFLDGRPVQARHGGKLYHLSRFVARHRWSVGFGSVAVLGMMGLTGFSFVQWKNAQREAERAKLAAQFMEEVLKATDPLVGNGGNTTAVGLMDTATQVMQEKLSAHPELGNPTSIQIANAYTNLGAINRAWPMYEKTIASMRQQKLPPLVYAAALERAVFAAQRDGHLEIAKQWMRELEPLLQGDSAEIARIRDGMNGTQWLIVRDGGDAFSGLRIAERALQQLQAHKKELPDLIQRATGRYGTALIDTGNFVEGEKNMRRAFEMAEQIFGVNHGRSLLARQSYGWCLSVIGKPELGLAQIEPLEIPMKTVFGEFSQNMGAHWHNRGNAYTDLGRLDDAIAAYRASARAYSGSTNPNSVQVGYAVWNVAGLQLSQKRFAEALDTLREVEVAWSKSMNANAPILGALHGDMARAEFNLGRLDVAQTHVERAMVLLRPSANLQARLAVVSALAGDIAMAQGKREQARNYFQTAIETLPKSDDGEDSLRKEWQAKMESIRPR